MDSCDQHSRVCSRRFKSSRLACATKPELQRETLSLRRDREKERGREEGKKEEGKEGGRERKHSGDTTKDVHEYSIGSC